MRFLTALCAAAFIASPLADAHARDRKPLTVDKDLAAEWVLQLSPGSGVVPGYKRQRVAKPYVPGTVVFEGNLPVGVVPAEGGPVQPLGAYREKRGLLSMFAEPERRQRYKQTGAVRQPVFAYAGTPARTARPMPAEAAHVIDPEFLPQTVAYRSPYPAGTIVIDTRAKFLYRVEGDGTARRYGVGVGKDGFSWTGSHKITRKAEWPGWTPPAEMIARERAKGHYLPAHMEGGIENPLGARAMYLGSTLYRIHGTNQPWTIGRAVSSGCIRMRNEDVTDLYERTDVGTRVIVL
jgi:lipoprotein-anchoring transpeptidase ErfK/SrfK